MCAATSLIHDSETMWFPESEAVGTKTESSKETVFNPQTQNLQHHQEIFFVCSYIVVIITITFSSLRMTVLIKMCELAMNFVRNNKQQTTKPFFHLICLICVNQDSYSLEAVCLIHCLAHAAFVL